MWKACSHFKHKRDFGEDVDAPVEPVRRCDVPARGLFEVVAPHLSTLGQWAAQLDRLHTTRSISLASRRLCKDGVCSLLRSTSTTAPLSQRPRQQTSRLGSTPLQSVHYVGSFLCHAFFEIPFIFRYVNLSGTSDGNAYVPIIGRDRTLAVTSVLHIAGAVHARLLLRSQCCKFTEPQANDAAVDGLYLPEHISSCCDEEEALMVQRKLDIVIAELTEIKDILCKHKVHSHTCGTRWVVCRMVTQRWSPCRC